MHRLLIVAIEAAWKGDTMDAWKRPEAEARDRAISIVENARMSGLLQGKVKDAIALRHAIVEAIEAHTHERIRRAEARLNEDGYRECSQCHEWYFGDDEEKSRLDETQGYCSHDCRDAAEPPCRKCGEVADPEHGSFCSEAHARAFHAPDRTEAA